MIFEIVARDIESSQNFIFGRDCNPRQYCTYGYAYINQKIIYKWILYDMVDYIGNHGLKLVSIYTVWTRALVN